MNCKNCKKQGCSLAGKNHEMSFECRLYIGKINADHIRAMTNEELAEFIKNLRFKNGGCPSDTKCEMRRCYDCWLDWLKQEVKNNE